MQKSNKLIITKFYYFVPLVLFLLVIFYLSGQYLSGTRKEQKKLVADKGKLIQKLMDVWEQGNLDRVSEKKNPECHALLKMKQLVSSEFFQCNPEYLNCFLADYSFYGYRPYKFQNKFYELDRLGNVILTFEKGDDYFRLRLFDTCSDVYLPTKKYSAGTKRENKYIWDNFDQNIFIDKYYVSNQDVLHWKKRTKREIKEEESKQLPFAPYLSLDRELMHQYCYEHGKKVVESRYFDAASYIPNKEDDPKVVKKFPYHWTKKRFVEEFDCFNVYSKGCESKRPFKYFEGMSTSWIGMHYVLGGFMEFLPNKFDAEKNLKVSSFYLDNKSHWHEIGVRGEFGKNNSTRTAKDIKVAFRCMVLK